MPGMVRGEVGGTEATMLGRGAGGQRAEELAGSRQLWDEPKPHPGVSEFGPRCRAGPRAPSAAQEMWAGDGARGCGCGQASPLLFFFLLENKSALLSLSFFPHLLFKFIWENLPECSHRCHQPDSLCRSNKMAL